MYYAAFSLCKKSLPAGLAEDTLEKECRAATKELGIQSSNLVFFDFEVRKFDEQRQAILEELVTLNNTIKPDLVFIPSSSDNHQDHEIIRTEALRAKIVRYWAMNFPGTTAVSAPLFLFHEQKLRCGKK